MAKKAARKKSSSKPARKVKKPDIDAGLNPKQLAFCKEYLKDFNATKAAIRSGYSEDTARQIGSQLLSKLNIQSQIQAFADVINERVDNEIERIILELQIVAFGSLRDVADWNANGLYVKDSEALDARSAKLVSEVKEHRGEKGTSISIKLHDKMKALEMLGRYHKIFTDKVEVLDLSSLSDEELLSKNRALMSQLEQAKT